jgi:hypothetical protein
VGRSRMDGTSSKPNAALLEDADDHPHPDAAGRHRR